MSGILEQINSTKPIYFKRLDTTMIMEALNTVVNNKRKRTINLFMGELSFISMDVEMNGHKYIKDIRHCMKMINYYRRLTSLMLIKKHHIEVGYSKMTMYEYELKYSTIIDKMNELENKIRRLYYGNS